ncbi:MAG: hypothetical protein GY705_21575 [Bacteroidetes bacterium]|nr:hypothetical protein [Bacteroidota bacterium]
MNNKKLTTTRFDINGNSIVRLTGFYLLSRIIPMGDNRGGPGIKCLLVLGLFQYWGRQVYWADTRFHRFTNLLRRIKRKLQKR